MHQIQQRRSEGSDRVEGDTADDGQENDLQDVDLNERLDHTGRHDVGDELPPLLVLALFDETVDRLRGLNGGNVCIHSLADRKEIDGQHNRTGIGEQGADLEVNQRLNACDVNLLQIGETGDAPNDVRNIIGPMSILSPR